VPPAVVPAVEPLAVPQAGQDRRHPPIVDRFDLLPCLDPLVQAGGAVIHNLPPGQDLALDFSDGPRRRVRLGVRCDSQIVAHRDPLTENGNGHEGQQPRFEAQSHGITSVRKERHFGAACTTTPTFLLGPQGVDVEHKMPVAPRRSRT
jgi:hypothetical protein